MIETQSKKERCIIVSAVKKGNNKSITHELLNEMSLLAETAGAVVIDKIYQEVEKNSVATLIGKGKVEEIVEIVKQDEISLVVFDNELSPVQLRNLEKAFNVKVLDRSGIILDIFASRAKTKQAKTQVELAQLQYMLPRLSRMWTHLSKQFGGIGTKGPGETQIETDRRLIRNRIEHLKDSLKEINKHNIQKRKNQNRLPRFGLVGYTNAGKSTLMKRITKENVYIENQLFATLDTTTRKFILPLGQEALLSDTVGFIRNLPTHLVASFESTLAEAKESDFLLHVVDISNVFFRDQIKTVDDTLKKLGINSENNIMVFNKIDMLEDNDEFTLIQEEYPDSIFVSAYKDLNINELLMLLQNKYDSLSKDFEIKFPYSDSSLLSKVYLLSEVLSQNNDEEGYLIKLRVQNEKVGEFNNIFGKYII
jgi:GTP-binding protein HflX